MSEISGKCRKRYVDYPKGKSKPTCLTHGPGYLSYESKVLVDFSYKHAKIRSTKDRRNYPVDKKTFNLHQENNAIVNSESDGILLHKNQKVNAEK